MERLNRIIIGEMLTPVSIESVADKLLNNWWSISKVRNMGFYKTLITFCSKEDMEEALTSRKDILLEHFAEVRRWSNEEVCQMRRMCGLSALEFLSKHGHMKI